jgi:hypothetical protein
MLEKYLVDATSRAQVRAAWNLGKLQSKHIVFIKGNEVEKPSIFHDGVFYGINAVELDDEAFALKLSEHMANPDYLASPGHNGFMSSTNYLKLSTVAYYANNYSVSNFCTHLSTYLDDYLTRQMVENVLTGLVTSHWHRNLLPEEQEEQEEQQTQYTDVFGAKVNKQDTSVLYVETQEDIHLIETTKASSVVLGPGEFIIDGLNLSPFVKTFEGTRNKTTLVLKSDKETALSGQGQSMKDFFILVVSTEKCNNAIKGFGGCINQIEDIKVFYRDEANSKTNLFVNCENFNNVAIMSGESSRLSSIADKVTAIKGSERVHSVIFRGLFGTFFEECEMISDCSIKASVSTKELLNVSIFKKSQAVNCMITADIECKEGSSISPVDGDSMILNTISRINTKYV